MRIKRLLTLVCALFLSAACGDAGAAGPGGAAGGARDEASADPVGPLPETSVDPMPNAFHKNRNANADIAAALGKAKRDKRQILLEFGAGWCPDCLILKDTFWARTVRPAIARYHVVLIFVGYFDRNLAVARKYGLNLHKSGIPAVVVLSDTGKVKTVAYEKALAGGSTLNPASVAAFLERWQ